MVYGTVAPGIKGLEALAGIPVCGSAGDQAAALLGQGCIEPGQAKNTYGTGCFTLLNTGSLSPRSISGLVTSVAWSLGGKTTYALEGSVFNAGSSIQWLRDEVGLIGTARECDLLAESVEDNGGVYLVSAFTGLGAPRWDMYARGAIVGLTRGSTRAHIARAALEGIAYQVKDLLDAMDEITAPEDTGAALEAVGCGVELLCTAHAGSVEDFRARPLYGQLVRGGVFKRAVIIGFRHGRRVYSAEDLQ